jgi:hypothetical protein
MEVDMRDKLRYSLKVNLISLNLERAILLMLISFLIFFFPLKNSS